MSVVARQDATRVRNSGVGQAHTPWQKLQRVLAYLVLTALSLVFCIPFFWLLSSSLKENRQLFAFPIIWIPKPITLEHYINGLQFVPFPRYVANTLFICMMTVLGALFSNTLVAYGLARIRWVLRLPIFYTILATMMIPAQVTMIPLFIVFRRLGWYDSFLPLVVPTFFGQGMYIFLLRQFFLTIPMELSEAAEVDGANELTIFWSIILPLTKPALATVALFQFLAAWGDYLGPLIYITDVNKYTVSLGLSLFQGQYTTEYGGLMAASTVMMLPVIILFFLTQRTFIEGITLTGIKG
jgi:multiple sugar transport system permease protein